MASLHTLTPSHLKNPPGTTNGTSAASCELAALPPHTNGVSPKTPKGDEPDPFDGDSAPVVGTTTASTVGISAAKSRTLSGRAVGGEGYANARLEGACFCVCCGCEIMCSMWVYVLFVLLDHMSFATFSTFSKLQ